MNQRFKVGDIVVSTSTKEIYLLKDFWQGDIGGYWLVDKGFYLADTHFEHACEGLKILFGMNHEDFKIK